MKSIDNGSSILSRVKLIKTTQSKSNMNIILIKYTVMKLTVFPSVCSIQEIKMRHQGLISFDEDTGGSAPEDVCFVDQKVVFVLTSSTLIVSTVYKWR